MKYKKENNRFVFTIDEQFHQKTILDIFHYYHLSKKTIHLLRQNKDIILNKEHAPYETTLYTGDELSLPVYDEGIDFIPQKSSLDIIYEDDVLLVINKPAGIIVHPEGKDGINTLCNHVAYYYKITNQNYPVRYIHRLDKETTGLMIFCKCGFFQPILDDMIQHKDIEKTYRAIVEGVLQDTVIHKPIGNDRHHKQKMIVSSKGKDAFTHVKVISTKNQMSLIECRIETGRKHQIRVHLSSIGHPILSDTLYGHKNQSMKRLALHAYRLRFIHPLTNKKMDIVCDVPKDMMIF